MSSLADSPQLVGFFSYSRQDDEDSQGALSALRDRIQRELRGQLGRSAKDFRLWQDKEAIAPGTLWESEIKAAIGEAMFIIPIVTPTTARSDYCRIEFESFLARERELGRSDLIFPLLYIRVPGLEDAATRDTDSVLSMIARRQYVDWREFRHRDVHTTQVSEAIERLCSKIVEALTRPDSPEAGNEPKQQERISAPAIQSNVTPSPNRPQAEQPKAPTPVAPLPPARQLAPGTDRRAGPIMVFLLAAAVGMAIGIFALARRAIEERASIAAELNRIQLSGSWTFSHIFDAGKAVQDQHFTVFFNSNGSLTLENDVTYTVASGYHIANCNNSDVKGTYKIKRDNYRYDYLSDNLYLSADGYPVSGEILPKCWTPGEIYWPIKFYWNGTTWVSPWGDSLNRIR